MTTTIEEQLKPYKKIVIIGMPRAGKTTLSNKLNRHNTVHTDDFIDEWSWDETPEKLIDNYGHLYEYCIEGVQGYRLLRTGLRDGSFEPEVVVICQSSSPPLKKHLAMRKSLEKIYADWLALGPECQIIFYQMEKKI